MTLPIGTGTTPLDGSTSHDGDDDDGPISSTYPWTVMLAGVPVRLQEACTSAAAPIPTLRSEPGQSTLEAIFALRPIVIVIGPELDGAAATAVRTRATIVRSSVVVLGETTLPLDEEIRSAIARAEAVRAAVRAQRHDNGDDQR